MSEREIIAGLFAVIVFLAVCVLTYLTNGVAVLVVMVLLVLYLVFEAGALIAGRR